ncbi:MAG: ATP-binding cassette domain-containing protein [Lachnospiraceae bacterium]
MELVVNKLTKCYQKGIKALDGFTYTFTEGVYGLLGPNGAGKSTFMNILTDNLSATEGEVLFNGENISSMGREYRKVLGYMPQQQGLYPSFTLTRFLYYMASLKGMTKEQAASEINLLIKKVNLWEDRYKKLGKFSGGMKQRALIAQALLGNPKLIVLDEPTAGLDPKERIRIRNLISEIALKKIVIIATHVVSDIEFISKEVIILQNGKIIKADTPKGLCDSMEGKVYEIQCEDNEWKEISKKYKISSMVKSGDRILVRVLADKICPEYTVREVIPSLEDVYLDCFEEDEL